MKLLNFNFLRVGNPEKIKLKKWKKPDKGENEKKRFRRVEIEEKNEAHCRMKCALIHCKQRALKFGQSLTQTEQVSRLAQVRI